MMLLVGNKQFLSTNPRPNPVLGVLLLISFTPTCISSFNSCNNSMKQISIYLSYRWKTDAWEHEMFCPRSNSWLVVEPTMPAWNSKEITLSNALLIDGGSWALDLGICHSQWQLVHYLSFQELWNMRLSLNVKNSPIFLEAAAEAGFGGRE